LSAAGCEGDAIRKDFAQGFRNDSRRGANFPMLFCGFLSVNKILLWGSLAEAKNVDRLIQETVGKNAAFLVFLAKKNENNHRTSSID
jgi:hypothetical protein